MKKITDKEILVLIEETIEIINRVRYKIERADKNRDINWDIRGKELIEESVELISSILYRIDENILDYWDKAIFIKFKMLDIKIMLKELNNESNIIRKKNIINMLNISYENIIGKLEESLDIIQEIIWLEENLEIIKEENELEESFLLYLESLGEL